MDKINEAYEAAEIEEEREGIEDYYEENKDKKKGKIVKPYSNYWEVRKKSDSGGWPVRGEIPTFPGDKIEKILQAVKWAGAGIYKLTLFTADGQKVEKAQPVRCVIHDQDADENATVVIDAPERREEEVHPFMRHTASGDGFVPLAHRRGFPRTPEKKPNMFEDIKEKMKEQLEILQLQAMKTNVADSMNESDKKAVREAQQTVIELTKQAAEERERLERESKTLYNDMIQQSMTNLREMTQQQVENMRNKSESEQRYQQMLLEMQRQSEEFKVLMLGEQMKTKEKEHEQQREKLRQETESQTGIMAMIMQMQQASQQAAQEAARQAEQRNAQMMMQMQQMMQNGNNSGTSELAVILSKLLEKSSDDTLNNILQSPLAAVLAEKMMPKEKEDDLAKIEKLLASPVVAMLIDKFSARSPVEEVLPSMIDTMMASYGRIGEKVTEQIMTIHENPDGVDPLTLKLNAVKSFLHGISPTLKEFLRVALSAKSGNSQSAPQPTPQPGNANPGPPQYPATIPSNGQFDQASINQMMQDENFNYIVGILEKLEQGVKPLDLYNQISMHPEILENLKSAKAQLGPMVASQDNPALTELYNLIINGVSNEQQQQPQS